MFHHQHLNEKESIITLRLIQFLEKWSSSSSRSKDSSWTVAGRMERLWDDLASAGFLTQRDIELVEAWGAALQVFGSATTSGTGMNDSLFPNLRSRIHNVALMGQFNYGDIPVSDIIFWVQKYKEYFSHVTIRGPFTKETVRELAHHGISAYVGPNDHGFWSPLQNLMLALEDTHIRNQASELEMETHMEGRMEGVLYIHDDALLNLTQFFSMAAESMHQSYRHGVFPTRHIIATQMLMPHATYKDPRTATAWQDDLRSQRSYKIYGNGSLFSTLERERSFSDFHVFQMYMNSLKPTWPQYKHCLEGQLMVAKHPNSSRYRELDGSILFSPFVQADFLYVPVDVAKEFAHAARLHLQEPPVFLECSFATVVDMVRRTTNVSVFTVDLCSKFKRGPRGTPYMIAECMRNNYQNLTFGMYHPFKLSKGKDLWHDMFDAILG